MRRKNPVSRSNGDSFLVRLVRFGLAATLLALGVTACELLKPTQPRASCSSDADCESNGRGDRFCIQGHCVQCMTSESCGPDSVCSEGVCFKRCKAKADCAADRACTDGFCVAP